MRLRHLSIAALECWSVVNLAIAPILGETAFRVERQPLKKRRAAETIAAQSGATLEDVSVIATDGVFLDAWFARPQQFTGNCVILLHGKDRNREELMHFFELFLSHGYSVLAPDSRAHGISGGAFPTYGIKETEDVRRWWQWLKDRHRPHRVFGLAHSMGAAILLQAIRTVPFCAVVCESSFATFREMAYIRLGHDLHTGKWAGKYLFRPAVELGFLYGLLTRGVDLRKVSPPDAASTTQVPVLLMHGLDDPKIPPHQSEEIEARNPLHNRLWELPGAGHRKVFQAAPEEVDRRVLEWFGSHAHEASEKVV